MSAPTREDRSIKHEEVLRLSLMEGCSTREISRRLGLSRRTVRGILGRGPKRPPPPPRVSMLVSYEDVLEKALKDSPDMRAPAVLERLRKAGFTGGITIVRERLKVMRPREPKRAYLTLDFEPGSAVQVDWADCGFAVPGLARRISAFVMVLCHSRMMYIEFTASQQMGTFLRCMERGLAFFGGSAEADIFDNMKTVVASGSGPRAVFNERFLNYAAARHFAARACNARSGNEKGRVERPIGFVRERFLPGRRFASLLDLNRQATEWRDTYANNRVHEVTGKVPSLVFENVEKPVLKPLIQKPFDTDEVLTTTITKMFRIRFDRNTYSVPPNLVGQTVLVRANDDAVAVYLGPKEVARHRRQWGIGIDEESETHREAVARLRPRAKGEAPSTWLEALGETGARYQKLLVAGSRSIERELIRITFLAEVFGTSATVAAMADVMATNHVGAEFVEFVLRHKKGLAPSPAPLRLGDPELDAVSFKEPDLEQYDRFVASRVTRDPGDIPPAKEAP
ncbi:MAG: hypothetical protein RL199_654 [Pseudomonadota bacterium]|jgi:transposase